MSRVRAELTRPGTIRAGGRNGGNEGHMTGIKGNFTGVKHRHDLA